MMQANTALEHRAKNWIRFFARNDALTQEEASDQPQKCKSTFGSDALASRIVGICALGFLAAGCNTTTVRESVLSTNQRVAMVSNPGDGVTPPTNLVLFEDRPGRYVPVAAGFAEPPATAFLTGAGAGIATGIGLYGARSRVNTVVQGTSAARATGGTGNGGTGNGGSVTLP
jgi:hypothetical protein